MTFPGLEMTLLKLQTVVFEKKKKGTELREQIIRNMISSKM